MCKLLKYQNTVSMNQKMASSYKVSSMATGISRSARVNSYVKSSYRGVTNVYGKNREREI